MDAESVATGGPRKVDRRQALVGAAYAQIARQGFEGLRTRDVADSAAFAAALAATGILRRKV